MENLTEKEKRYRAMPFWAWNGTLEEGELCRQIDIMKQMGFGGFFMHSRTGLRTEYLGEEWFRLIRVCADYAVKSGLEAWIYDEDRWPSGAAGGLASKKGKLRMRFISLYTDDSYLQTEEVERVLCRFAVRLNDDGSLEDYYLLKRGGEIPKPGYVLHTFCEERMKCSPQYNGYSYIDTMNSESTKEFMRLTHELYKNHCGDMFGKQLVGVFTDEPHRGPLFNRFGLDNENGANMAPFTGRLFSYYKSRWNQDLRRRLPELFYKGKTEWNETAYRYVICLNDLFINNFAKPYYDWCRKNNLLLTGHLLHEDSLRMQTSMNGSLMRYYEYMDYPGIDILGEGNACYWVPKQCASVARQLGKEMVLTELYGCTGWQMTFEAYKICTEWQILFGANFRCPHISWYSMRGQAKRDYPASILHQSAWYPYYSYLENYFSRLTAFVEDGHSSVQTLVISAVESMFGYVHKGWLHIFDYNDACIGALEKRYEDQFFALIGKHIDFDYADEDILARHAAVEEQGGKIYLRVGKARYTQVLKDDMQHLRESTKKILNEFASMGGTVVDGTEELDVSDCVRTEPSIAVRLTEKEGELRVFLLNLDREKEKFGVKVSFPQKYEELYAEEWDLFENRPVRVWKPGEDIVLDFHKAQSHTLRLVKSPQAIPDRRGGFERVRMPEYMPYSLTEPNVLVLDKAVVSADNIPMNGGEPIYVLKADTALRKKFRLVPRGGDMIQPWYDKKYNGRTGEKLCGVRLKFTFFIADMPEEPVYLAMEEFEGHNVRVNGRTLKGEVRKGWVDDCFDTVQIPSHCLKPGENEIEMSGAFNSETGLESIYLLGKFGVTLPSTIERLPKFLRQGDIGPQGLPFYSGSVIYHTGIRGKDVCVELRELNCALAVVRGGREEKKYIVCAPYSAEISVKKELTIECVFTRRNTFGPHHNLPYPDISYPPACFVSEGANWTDDYVLENQGMRIAEKEENYVKMPLYNIKM